MKPCICADPNNCTTPLTGYRCRRGDAREQVRRAWKTVADKHAFAYNPEYLNEGYVDALMEFVAAATVRSADAERLDACLHACEGLDTIDLARNEKGWLAEVVMSAARVERERDEAMRACCPGNGDEPDPVRCQCYEASEQGQPCPPGCCAMADEKDVRALMEAIEREDGATASSATTALHLEADEVAAIRWLQCHHEVRSGPSFMPDDGRKIGRILKAIDKLQAALGVHVSKSG